MIEVPREELLVLEAQLDRVRSMLYRYYELFFRSEAILAEAYEPAVP